MVVYLILLISMNRLKRIFRACLDNPIPVNISFDYPPEKKLLLVEMGLVDKSKKPAYQLKMKHLEKTDT